MLLRGQLTIWTFLGLSLFSFALIYHLLKRESSSRFIIMPPCVSKSTSRTVGEASPIELQSHFVRTATLELAAIVATIVVLSRFLCHMRFL